MAIYQIAEYRVNSRALDKVRRSIEEPGTRLYVAWQQKKDPTRFVHFFIFENEAAHKAHGESAAVKRFESVYSPELAGGDVVFTDYDMVATNQG